MVISSSHSKKRTLVVILMICSGIFLGLIVSEFGLRFWVRRGSPESHPYLLFERQRSDNELVFFRVPTHRKVKDPAVGWEQVPNTQFGYTRINSAGFRGPEYTKMPSPGTVRIAFMGDSETFAERLREEEAPPGALQRQLTYMDRNRKYEVLNFGVLGYNTAQEFERLKRKAILYNPSIVVLYFSFNDPEITAPIDFTTSRFLVHFQLFRFANYYYHSMQTVDDLKNNSRNINDYFNRLYSSLYFDACQKIIKEMGEYLDARNIPFYLLIAPELREVKDFKENYPYHGIHQKLAALASPKITVVDSLPSYAHYFKKDPSSLMITPFDPHKNREANWVAVAVLATAIYEKITGTRYSQAKS